MTYNNERELINTEYFPHGLNQCQIKPMFQAAIIPDLSHERPLSS